LRYKFFVDFSKIGGYENEAEGAVIVFVSAMSTCYLLKVTLLKSYFYGLVEDKCLTVEERIENEA
jgi:hypothetical protein